MYSYKGRSPYNCRLSDFSFYIDSQILRDDFIVSNHVDILTFTATWLGSEIDKVVVAEMIPSGYDIHHVSRIGQKGGGVALIYNRSAEVKLVKQQNTYTNFELIECDVKTENVGFRIFVVYRPPPSKKNNFQVSAFLDDFSLLLQSSTAMSEEMIITGDLNFILDDPSDQNARKFLNILDEQGFVQHVVGATHIRAILLTSL